MNTTCGITDHSRGEKYERFTVAPPILEDRYNVEDAVCVGGILISLLRHCDRVKIGCLAQLVNVIAPIMTVRGGGVWKQTIYYPFRSFAGLKDSTVLHTLCESDTCSCAKFGEIPALDSVTALRDDGTAVIFAVNRSTDQTPASYRISRLSLICRLNSAGTEKRPTPRYTAIPRRAILRRSRTA